MRILVTGGAGFIGSHLCERLIENGEMVWCVDNLVLGKMRNIAHLQQSNRFHFENLDVLDRSALDALFANARFDAVFHLAANSDISAGTRNFRLDLELNQLTTLSVLELMHAHGVKRLLFSSTSAIFGEADGALHEGFGPLQPISFYGASKLSAEAYISVFAHTLGINAVVLRFPNVVGEHSTHGILFDFLAKLKKDSTRLDVLGDGRQTKPYLYVQDLLDAMLLAWEQAAGPYSVYHVAGVGETSVDEIAKLVVAAAGSPETRIYFSGGDRGWPGDVPRFRYDTARIMALGWRPRYHSTQAVDQALKRILQNGF